MFIAKTIIKFDILHKCSFRSFCSDCLLHLTIVQVPENLRPNFFTSYRPSNKFSFFK